MRSDRDLFIFKVKRTFYLKITVIETEIQIDWDNWVLIYQNRLFDSAIFYAQVMKWEHFRNS